MVANVLESVTDDPFLTDLIAEVREDPETLGLLHGSRALGKHRADSDYDLIRVVSDQAYSDRRDRATHGPDRSRGWPDRT